MKNSLIESANKIPSPATEFVREFSNNREQLVVLCNKKFAARGDLAKLIGHDNLQMALNNNQNFSMFMESIFSDYDATVLVETVLWVFRAYRAHGFQTLYWAANLSIWEESLKVQLSPECYEAIAPYYDWLIVNIPLFTLLTETGEEQG